MTTMEDFVFNWKKVLNWKKDPFDLSVGNGIEFFSGYEREKEAINLFVLNKSKFGTIIGDEGIGKTMLIGWLKNHLDRHRNRFIAVYLDKEDLSEKSMIKKMLKPFNADQTIFGALGKLVNKKKGISKKNIHEYIRADLKNKKYVLLIEDAELLQAEDIDLLANILEIKNTSVILTGRKDLKKLNTKKLGKDEMSLTVRELDFESARSMIAKRIQAVGGHGIHPFDDKLLSDLFNLADHNPSKILRLCAEKAKELAVEERIGKKEDEVKYDQKVENHKTEHKRSGFSIKFSVDDDEPAQEIQKEKEEEKTETTSQILIDLGYEKEKTSQPVAQRGKEIIIDLETKKSKKGKA